jgi:hypothetical protein
VSQEIIEYDIKSAGFNLIKKYKLLNDKKIEHLESLDKKKRQIMIGLYEKNDKELKKNLNLAFVDARRIFFESNNLQDDDILSIKKDAIITTKRCDKLIFDNVEFVEKHIYTSYYYINKFEFYLGTTGIDVKGINDEKLELHKDFMLDFLFKIFKMMETTSREIIIKNIKEFSYYYKTKQLEIGYYRELNKDSLFKLHHTLLKTMVGVVDTDDVSDIDINYNFMHYIIPIINLLI